MNPHLLDAESAEPPVCVRRTGRQTSKVEGFMKSYLASKSRSYFDFCNWLCILILSAIAFSANAEENDFSVRYSGMERDISFGLYPEALAKSLEASKRKESKKEKDSELAYLYRRISLIYERICESVKAEEFFGKYLALMEENPGLQDDDFIDEILEMAPEDIRKNETIKLKALSLALERFPKKISSALNSILCLYSNGTYNLPMIDEGFKISEKTIEMVSAKCGLKSEAYARSLLACGKFNEDIGLYSEALDYYEKALGIYTGLHGPDHPECINALWSLFVFYRDICVNNDKAKDLLSRMIASGENTKVDEKLRLEILWVDRHYFISSQIFGLQMNERLFAIIEFITRNKELKTSSDANEMLWFLVSADRNMKAQDIAVPAFIKNYIESYKKNLFLEYEKATIKHGANSVEALEKCMMINEFLVGDDNDSDTIKYLKAALVIKQSLFGKYSVSIVRELEELSWRSDDFEKSEEYLNEIRNVIRKTYGKNHPANIEFLMETIPNDCEGSLGEERDYLKVVDIAKANFGEESLETTKYMRQLASAYLYMLIQPFSNKIYYSAYDMQANYLHFDKLEPLFDYVSSILPEPKTKFKEMNELYSRILEIEEKNFGAESVYLLPLLVEMADSKIVAGEKDAEDILKMIFKILERESRKNEKARAISYLKTVEAMNNSYSLPQTRKILAECLEMSKNDFGEKHLFTAKCHWALGKCDINSNDAEAEKEFLEAIKIFQNYDFLSFEFSESMNELIYLYKYRRKDSVKTDLYEKLLKDLKTKYKWEK